MPRKDKNGKGLQAVLSYLLDRAVPATEIYSALGIVRNTYHGRIEEDSYPNAEEIRLVAERFDLNPLDLLLTFGLIEEHHLRSYLSPVATRSTATAPAAERLEKLSDLSRRTDVSSI